MINKPISQQLIDAANYMMTQNTFPGVHNPEFFVARDVFEKLALEVEISYEELNATTKAFKNEISSNAKRESLWLELIQIILPHWHHVAGLPNSAEQERLDELRKQLGISDE